MGAATTRSSLKRDYFILQASAGVLAGLGLAGPFPQGLVLELEPPVGSTSNERRQDARAPAIAYPRGVAVLATLALTPRTSSSDDQIVEVLAPRSAFDHVADHFGARRITTLSLRVGDATGDTVLDHLAASLAYAIEARPIDRSILSDLAVAVVLHIAQRYGHMEPLPQGARGGLSSWQLRLARKRLDQHLDGEISLEALAAECGLSQSHFTRAFANSTGLTPHRWLMQRRVEAAKDLILRSDMPLAQVALDCGFSDQSHFTRVFSSLIGLTPARWRLAQEQVWAVEGERVTCR